MKTIKNDELKLIQMDVLSAVDKFCAENNIMYSISDGTILGAVRHGGYIPWDDDIDIMMPRSEYERFEQLFPERYLSKYQVASLKRENSWYRAYSVVYDNRTMQVEETVDTPFGVGIDVFPVDDVPDSGFYLKCFFIWVHVLSMALTIKALIWRKERSFLKNAFLFLLKMLLLPISRKSLANYYDTFIQKQNGKGFSCQYQSSFGIYGKRPFARSIFSSINKMKFEDRYYCAVKDYNEYLSSEYGDYMTLPPIDKRVSTHPIKAFWR